MKRPASHFDQDALVFAEEIKLTANEHGLPEIWVSAQLRDRLNTFFAEKKVSVVQTEVLIPQTKHFYAIHRLVLHGKLRKKEVVDVVRAFLETLPTDWIEPYHEDSETPDFTFQLPAFKVRRGNT